MMGSSSNPEFGTRNNETGNATTFVAGGAMFLGATGLLLVKERIIYLAEQIGGDRDYVMVGLQNVASSVLERFGSFGLEIADKIKHVSPETLDTVLTGGLLALAGVGVGLVLISINNWRTEGIDSNI